MSTVQIKNRIIGENNPTYIIAEMSGNHAGSLERAKEIICAAKESGADCIKIQTYTPDTLTIDCNNSYFRVENGTWQGENLYQLYGKAYTPWEWQPELKAKADEIGIDFLSTPFDTTSVDFLEEMGLDFYKIASFEMIDIPLLKYVASKHKPIILSTGMGTVEEIKEAVEAIRSCGNEQIILLKCSSAYPAKIDDMHLRTIVDMQQRFGCPIGLSDHSMGHMSAATAVALGANVIEKHFCLGREIENPDASFSMTPVEFRAMADEIRSVESALGGIAYGVSKQEESSMVFRRSLFVVEDVKKGERFNERNLRVIRPGYGEQPKYIYDALGMYAQEDINRGTPFSFEQIEKGSILFLSNNDNSLALFEWLKGHETDNKVYHIQNKISLDMIQNLEPFFVISYNYRHLIHKDVLDYLGERIINLHASYLPYNRGSSPNFFSFLDNTPKGVTIHIMSEKLDAGDIICQKQLQFDESKETFESSYEELQRQMIQLFMDNWDAIKEQRIPLQKQQGEGTYHVMKEVDAFRANRPFSWNDNIAEMKKKYGL